MSLFPAYSESNKETTDNKTENEPNWLVNSSFKIDLVPNTSKDDETPKSEPNHDSSPKPTTKRKKNKDKSNKRHKSKHKRHEKDETADNSSHSTTTITENDLFDLDKDRIKAFFNMRTLPRPPRYSIAYYVTNNINTSKRKKKFKRYYQRIINENDEKSNSETEEIITKNTVDKIVKKPDENFTGFKQEGDLSETTANYNRKLTTDPKNIKLWLEYVRFQDVVYQFEKTYRKGSIAKGLRVMAERKLAIIDKALSYNSNCEELLRERLNIAVSVYPSDELQIQLRNLVDKDQGNIILWQGYIESTQCSMSHCNTPAVVSLYSKCLSVLHKIRRNVTVEKQVLEESILRMLYQCGLFLKQAGLFEQLWTLLRLYLELNLSSNDKNKFNITSGFDDQQLFELEEVIYKSQLPLHELWLRIEKLRESCHWLPYTEDDPSNCEDPQRLIFTEDVAELIHPITRPENIIKLTATILNLLKIPLLPCRHTTIQDLGLDYVPWALDSIESLLPLFLPLYPIDLSNNYLIIDSRLAVGPQYLKILPGQEEYLNFILTIMKSCVDCMEGFDRLVLNLWWIRFQKLLIILDKTNRFKIPKNSKTKIKSNLKNLLKQEENRNNIFLYCEYALYEFELGNRESCLNILKTSLKFIKTKRSVSLALIDDFEQISVCYLNRTLIEFYLKTGTDKDIILKQLITFVLEKNELVETLTADLLEEAELKFKNLTLQILQKQFLIKKLSITEQMLPNFVIDWLICNGWFIYLTKGPISCGVFIENILNEIDGSCFETGIWQKEVLFEFYVAILFKHCIDNPGYGIFKVLDDVLYRAIDQFPNNLFLLSVLAKEESLMKSSCGPSWWKIKKLLIKTGRALPILFLVLISNQQINYLEESLVETVTGNKYEINTSFKNKMLSLFRCITRSDICTRRCGLIWRLYLQFVHTNFDASLCRNVYYIAVEECPWLKALYIDAAIYIPAELAQIQDLLIEKQLRLHVTPEELDVLRN